VLSARPQRQGDVYLPPGLLYAAAAPCVISTVLGSCVAICLWSPGQKTGGMNHYLLPRGAGPEASPRFGETALALLLARLHALGSATDSLQARIYGGASLLQMQPIGGGLGLGEQNVAVARRFAEDLGIPVVDEDVLGQTARRVLFDVATGQAQVVRLGVR
jgi:chemotaxis protein CheD